MKTFQTNIDKLVSKILSEEIDSKVRKIMETKSEFDEELTGSQSKIDVAQPKGKITFTFLIEQLNRIFPYLPCIIIILLTLKD